MLRDVTKAIGLSDWTPDKPLLFILKVYFPAIRKVFNQPVTSHISPSHNFVHYFSLSMRNKLNATLKCQWQSTDWQVKLRLIHKSTFQIKNHEIKLSTLFHNHIYSTLRIQLSLVTQEKLFYFVIFLATVKTSTS